MCSCSLRRPVHAWYLSQHTAADSASHVIRMMPACLLWAPQSTGSEPGSASLTGSDCCKANRCDVITLDAGAHNAAHRRSVLLCLGANQSRSSHMQRHQEQLRCHTCRWVGCAACHRSGPGPSRLSRQAGELQHVCCAAPSSAPGAAGSAGVCRAASCGTPALPVL